MTHNIADKENNIRESTDEEQLDAHLIGPRKVYHRDGKDIEDAAAFDASPKKLGKVSTPFAW
jgi:hypothetical protein